MKKLPVRSRVTRGSRDARGLYRRRKKDESGELRNAGAYIIDIRIKKVSEFAGMKLRLCKTTGVYPQQNNAAATVSGMKAMVKELIRDRDSATLKKIQGNRLTLPSVYAKWVEGRIHLAGQYEDAKIAKKWREYLNTATLAPITRVNRLAVVEALISNGLLAESDVFNDLPVVLKKMRDHYERKRQHAMYNATRGELLTFLVKGLDFDEGSQLFLQVKKVALLKGLKRREHQPFVSPRDCFDFCDLVRARPSKNAESYAEAVLFMCLHGMRPTEFSARRFDVDSVTGHLRLKGTKNENAKRVVPLMSAVPKGTPPNEATLNRFFERMKSPVRCRDFRRTYSIWCMESGILDAHVKSYMGHGDKTVTQTYQTMVPKKRSLDENRDKLAKWIDGVMRQPRAQAKKTVPLSIESMFRVEREAAKLPSARDILSAIAKGRASDDAADPSLREMEEGTDDMEVRDEP